MEDLIIISGISGSGKTTLGREIAKRLGYRYVDIDSFYVKDKPRVTLSDRSQASNWDCYEALDLELFKEVMMSNEPIVLTTFLPVDYLLSRPILVHFHLSTGLTSEERAQRCIQARQQSKGFTGEKAKRDEMVVREVVMPFYEKNRLDISSHNRKQIDVYINGQRRSINNLVDEMLTAIYIVQLKQ